MWRSLVAHLTGGQGVAGSNPVIQTVFSQVSNLEPFGLAVAREDSAGNLRVRESFRAQQGGGAVLGLFGRGSPGPGDDRRCDDLPTGTARPAGEDLRMSVRKGGATRAVRVDAHQHFWDPTTADYPWMSDAPDVVRRPYRPDDLTPILAAAHIDAAVVVQARLDMDETRALLRTADEVDAAVGVVGWVDPIGGGSAGRTSSAGCASPRRRGSASTCSSGLVSCRQPLTSRQWSPRSGSSLTTWANPPCATVSTVGGHRRSGVLAPRAT